MDTPGVSKCLNLTTLASLAKLRPNSSMFNINQQTEHAFLILSYLDDRRRFTPLSTLTKKLRLPRQFAAKTASQLVKADVLESKEGKAGGYRLAKKAKNIKPLEVLEIFEGDLKIVRCQTKGYRCPWDSRCNHKNFFTQKLANLMVKEMKRWSLKDVLQS